MGAGPLLELENLSTHYVSARGTRVVRAVEGVNLRIDAGETLGIVGESGSGKSTLALTILRLLPPAAQIASGRMMFEGEDLLQKSEAEMRHVRGKRIAMILQDPMASLNPLFTIGDQVAEPIRVHESVGRGTAWSRARDLLKAVRIASPQTRLLAAPARDVRRHAPAHRRRHRHLLRAAAPDRRRADDEPRPDDPGPVPEPPARAAARSRPGPDLHHPQSRHRRQDVRPADRDVRGQGGGAGASQTGLQCPRPSLHPGAAQLHSAHDRQPAAPHRHRRPAARSCRSAARMCLRTQMPQRRRSLPRCRAAGDHHGRRAHGALLADGAGTAAAAAASLQTGAV